VKLVGGRRQGLWDRNKREEDARDLRSEVRDQSWWNCRFNQGSLDCESLTISELKIASEIDMKSRPRTKLVLKRKARRCPKCGAKLNNQKIRCKRCTMKVAIPRK
jgi:hypothetical protein